MEGGEGEGGGGEGGGGRGGGVAGDVDSDSSDSEMVGPPLPPGYKGHDGMSEQDYVGQKWEPE